MRINKFKKRYRKQQSNKQKSLKLLNRLNNQIRPIFIRILKILQLQTMEAKSKRNHNRATPKTKDENTIPTVDTTRIIEPTITEITDKARRIDNIIKSTAIIIKAGHIIKTTKTATTTTTREGAGITKIKAEITKRTIKDSTQNIKARQRRTKEKVATHLWNQLPKKCTQLRKQNTSVKIDNL